MTKNCQFTAFYSKLSYLIQQPKFQCVLVNSPLRYFSSVGTHTPRYQQQSESTSCAVTDRPQGKYVSRAMLAYMEQSKRRDDFIKRQLIEYNIGKRHLANMMNQDVDTFTQEDIDKAISYLFPTGIFDKRARPSMQHPDEVFPKYGRPQFDMSGRPYHHLFYTKSPLFYQLLHTIAVKLEKMNNLVDKAKDLAASSNQINFHGSSWLTIKQLQTKLHEHIKEPLYEEFIRAMNRLSEHQLSHTEKEFIFQQRILNIKTADKLEIPNVVQDAQGRDYVEAVGHRKTCQARVTVRRNGTGRFTVDGVPLARYFFHRTLLTGDQDLSQIMYPLKVCGLLDAVDVEASITYPVTCAQNVVEGHTARAGALRHALALALCGLVDETTVSAMRTCGLLQRDVRIRERKKCGKKGARRGRTWKKR